MSPPLPVDDAAVTGSRDPSGRSVSRGGVADDVELARLHVGVQRLTTLYEALLGRNPSGAEIRAGRSAIAWRLGMLLTMISVGLSREARRRPGWLSRLVRCADASQGAPPIMRRWLTRPIIGVLDRFEHERGERPAAPSVADVSAVTAHAPPHATPPNGLTIVGYLSGNFGIGEAARSLARSCIDVGVPVEGVDVCFQRLGRSADDTLTLPTSSGSPAVELFYMNAEETIPTRAVLGMAGRKRAPYTIGFWHWEQPRIPERHHAAFAELNEVWVPSTFVQDAVAPVSPVPVFKVPHAVRFTPSPEASRASFGLDPDRRLVLVMFDFQSYQYRKNPQAAIAAFRLAARKANSLGLVVKTHYGETEPDARAELHECLRDLPHVTCIDESLSRQRMWDLQSCCDILLSLHRAEGFGLCPAEMMYLGKPVVATGWSANMDFMDADNSMPVRYRLVPLAKTVGPYDAGPLWAEADVEHAAWCLCRLAEDPALAERIGARARVTIREKLDPLVVGRQVAERLETIRRWHGRDA